MARSTCTVGMRRNPHPDSISNLLHFLVRRFIADSPFSAVA
jgi:hypothetical protein